MSQLSGSGTPSKAPNLDLLALVDRFESAWRRDEPLAVCRFLGSLDASEADPSGISRVELARELVKVDLEYGWRAASGRGWTLEDYARECPELGAWDQIPLDVIAEEYYVRQRWGDRPAREAFLARFPKQAESLRSCLAEIDAKLGPPFRAGLEECRIREALQELPHLAAAGGDEAVFPIGKIPGYTLTDELGRGAMGVVYRARQTDLDRPVALKVLQAGALAGEEDRARFHREALAAARLQHPNIVQVFATGENAGQPFLVMEYVDGGTLAKRVTAQSLPAPAAARLLERLARAVAYAHERGVIHRDLKPTNVLLDRNGEPKIADFGMAKCLGTERSLDAYRTQTGAILGTPAYMAPEQVSGANDQVGPAADIYALGAILYEATTGQPPFRAATVLEMLDLIRSTEPVKPRRWQPLLPRDLETIVLKALAKEPLARYMSAVALADDLQRFLTHRPILARRSTPFERLSRWCRRNPVIAGLNALALALILIVAIVSTIAAVRLRTQRDEMRRAETVTRVLLSQSRRLEAERTAELLRSYLAQAHASRVSRRVGQRFEALDAIDKAVRIARDVRAPAAQWDALRDEAIAALALPDIRQSGTLGRVSLYGEPRRDVDERFERYAVVDRTGIVSVRRVRDGKEVYKFPSLDPARGAWVTLSRDGQTAVVYLEAGYQRAESGRQQVWRLAGPKPTLLLDLPPDCRSWQDTALSPDSRFYLYRTPSAPLLRCELATGRTQALPASDGTIRALAFHPDSQHVAVGLEQNNTWRLEVRTMDDARPTVTVALPVPVLTLNWNPDGRQVIATTRDEKLYTCDTVRGVLRIYEGIKNNGVALEFGRRGNVFVTNGWEHKLRLWNARTGGQILSLPLQADFPMRFAADGRNLLGQQNEPVYPLHEIADGWECRILGGPPFGSLKGGWLSGNQAIRGDGRLAGVSMGWHVNRVCLWDLDAGEEVANLATGLGTAAIFDADGALLTLGPSGLHRWPIHLPDPSGTPGPHPWRVGPPEVLLKGDFGRGAIARSRDGQVLALGAFGTSRPLILHRGAGEPIVLGPQPNVRQIAVSPDGRWVATGSWNGTDAGVFVWDAATGRKVQVLPAVDTGSVDFSGDGQWLVTGKRDSRLWQVGSWQPGVTLGGSGNFTFSPDGSLLAEAQFEPYVRLRDPETGRTLARLDDPSQNRASRLAFSPDGTRLAYVGDESYALHVWDLRLIRRQLALRGLDWDRPAYAAAPDSERAVAPILIEVEGSKR